MNIMNTVTEVLNRLRENGYTIDFNLKNNCLVCYGNVIYPDEFVVDEHFRFESPSDETIIYAISSPGHNIKGVLLNCSGIYSGELTDEMVRALSGHKHPSEGANAKKENKEMSSVQSVSPKMDAELTQLDINAFKIKIRQEDTWKSGDRNSLTLLKTEDLRIVLIALRQGAQLITHTAPGIITVQVLEGRITFRTGIRLADLPEGEIVVLQAGIPHSVLALEESVFLLTIAIKKV